MSQISSTPEECFAEIVGELLQYRGVTPPLDGSGKRRGFGSSELKVQHKIFAMLVRGKLVVKLPRARVDTLIAAGMGERFDPRHDGRLMKEWLVIAPAFQEDWLPLATEAMKFVAAYTTESKDREVQ